MQITELTDQGGNKYYDVINLTENQWSFIQRLITKDAREVSRFIKTLKESEAVPVNMAADIIVDIYKSNVK